MTDIIQKINAYLAENPYAMRVNIAKATGTTVYKLDCLHKAGDIKLPPRTSASMAARIGRAKTKARAAA